MKRFLWLLVLICLKGYGQETISFSLFYDTDVYQLTEKQRLNISNKFSLIDKEDIRIVEIKGYADFVDTKYYNNELSQSRAEMVYDFIGTIIDTSSIKIKKKAFGEEFSEQNYQENGNPKDRRVDVSVVFKRLEEKIKDSLFLGVPIRDLTIGMTIKLENLYFFRGRTKMYDYSSNELDSLGAFLKRNKNFKIEIHGHVCCGGDDPGDVVNIDTKTKTLSMDRAKSIYKYLIKTAGISPNRLGHKGFGFSKPKSWPEETIQDERDNRRVEIKIIDF